THVFRQRRLRVDREMNPDLRTERLAEIPGAPKPSLGRSVGCEGRVLEVLRADADDDGLPGPLLECWTLGEKLRRKRNRLLAEVDGEAAVLAGDGGLDHVHRGAADEAADEQVDRMVVQVRGLGTRL